MKAKEKFERRVKELGFDPADIVVDDPDNDKVAKIVGDEIIIVGAYLQSDGSSVNYAEDRYPSYEQLLKMDKFKNIVAGHFAGIGQDHPSFMNKLYEWLLGVSKECPLSPIDVTWLEEDFRKVSITFNDDPGLMDTSNGHDAKLVEEINQMHALHGSARMMYVISNLLPDHVISSEISGLDSLTEVLYEILQHWCDDDDLKKIIKYCGSRFGKGIVLVETGVTTPSHRLMKYVS